jgi:predicted amidophosphoribosyltransferase
MRKHLETHTGETQSARRLVGLERSYECASCGAEHRSWTRLRSCPDCGEHLAVAVIRRAALVPA